MALANSSMDAFFIKKPIAPLVMASLTNASSSKLVGLGAGVVSVPAMSGGDTKSVLRFGSPEMSFVTLVLLNMAVYLP